MTAKQLDLIEQICPMCEKPESEVGELHPDDQLCSKCEGEWVDFTLECCDDS